MKNPNYDMKDVNAGANIFLSQLLDIFPKKTRALTEKKDIVKATSRTLKTLYKGKCTF